MYNTSLRILGNIEESEDILQEAFLDAFQKIESFRGESTFGAWLKAIVINKSLGKLNQRKLFFTELNQSHENFEANEEEDFEAGEQTIQLIKKLLLKMSDGYRIVLSLYLFEGYDHQEIADILGISEVTSRTQYLRAKQRLLKLYYENQ